MKARGRLLTAALLAALLAGCANWNASVVPPVGLLYTDYAAPLTPEVTDVPVSLKKGSASTRHLSVPFSGTYSVAWDDASLQKVAEEAGLKEVYYADYEVFQILRTYTRFTVNVYGE